MMRRFLTVVGARPQFIKAAMVSRRLRREPDVVEILLHTGQHYDDNMSDVFFRELEIPRPDYNLGVGSGSHGLVTGRMLAGIEEVILREAPSRVLVYGDTNSTLAGALAAVKVQVPVAHIEAGLRSFNRRMPEEINRILTDHCADLLFAPTETAVANLRAEGIPEGIVHRPGDVMYDAALHYGQRARRESHVLEQLGLGGRSYVLCTVHRAENTDDTTRLRAIVEGLTRVSREITVVWPLHPRTRAALKDTGVRPVSAGRLRIIDPVGYLAMVALQQSAALIATDSGGVQKEAFFYRVPCVTLRGETEWVETVSLGWNRLVEPLAPAAVAEGILKALADGCPTGRPVDGGPYGDGDAAQAIVRVLARA